MLDESQLPVPTYYIPLSYISIGIIKGKGLNCNMEWLRRITPRIH